MLGTTTGIDVAVDPKATVACRIEWFEDHALVVPPIRPVDDDRLEDLLASGGPCGLDVPLGWPIQFVDALSAHRDFRPWPASAVYESLILRATDRWIVQETKLHPLSVSTDRIGRTAIRVAAVTSEISAGWPASYRAGVVGGVVEVYPAAALSRWASRRFRYKSGPRRAAELAALAAELVARPWLTFESEGCRKSYSADGDNFDALVASLVARAHAKGLCEPIPPEQVATAALEGWIALPRVGTFDALPDSRA